MSTRVATRTENRSAARGIEQPRSGETRRRKVWPARVTAWVLLTALVLGWWAFLRPSSLGGPLTFITVTGVSMEPGLHTDDVAVMYERDSYAKGDVVAFRSEVVDGEFGAFVIHRIRGGDGDRGFVMRGDNNGWDDPWTPTSDEVAGKMLFSVPNLGAAMRWISQPIHLAALMAAVMAALVIGGGPDSGSKRRSKHTDDEECLVPAQRSGTPL